MSFSTTGETRHARENSEFMFITETNPEKNYTIVMIYKYYWIQACEWYIQSRTYCERMLYKPASFIKAKQNIYKEEQIQLRMF